MAEHTHKNNEIDSQIENESTMRNNFATTTLDRKSINEN